MESFQLATDIMLSGINYNDNQNYNFYKNLYFIFSYKHISLSSLLHGHKLKNNLKICISSIN